MELVKKYSNNVIDKALNMKVEVLKETETFIILLAPTKHSENQFYRITYNKNRDEFNCECQEFKFKRKCSHSLKAVRLIKGYDEFWMEATKSTLK